MLTEEEFLGERQSVHAAPTLCRISIATRRSCRRLFDTVWLERTGITAAGTRPAGSRRLANS